MPRFLPLFLASSVLFVACQYESLVSYRKSSSGAATEEADDAFGVGLAAADCANEARINSITISQPGSLFINDPRVVGDARAKGTGPWSFPFLMREILELPVPGQDPAKLKIENDKIVEMLDNFTTDRLVNSFKAQPRPQTRKAIADAWKKVQVGNQQFLTFDGAPFKLVAMTNRMDIAKKNREDKIAGEGRFVFGFTGQGRMTIILEYNLPIGEISPTARTEADYALAWYRLKRFLKDTDANAPGVQPAPGLAKLEFTNLPAYLNALQTITDTYTLRTARKGDGRTWAPINAIRTNEFIQSPWEIREMTRPLTTLGNPSIRLMTVKNNPDRSFASGGKGLKEFIAANVACKNPQDLNTCDYTTARGMLPPDIQVGAQSVSLLGASAPVDFAWFPGNNDPKMRFAALNTCSGCHQSETGTAFVHVNEVNGAPSEFLKGDLKRRLLNLKAQVCLAATGAGQLNLAGQADADPIAVSYFSH